MSLPRSLRAAAAPLAARLAARPAAAALARPSPQLLSALRSFSSDAKAAEPAAAPAAPAVTGSNPTPSSFRDVVARYGGWYPFLGLAGAAAISKEVVILNEELLLVSNFAAMFGILYLGAGDTVTKGAEEQRAELAKKQDEYSDLQIEALQMAVQAHELNIEQVEVLKRLKTEHNTLSAELTKARALKLRHAARDAVVKRLSDLKGREASERASFKEVVSKAATEYVRAQFASAPPAVKNQLVEFAIDVVEGKKKQMDAKQDPVKKLYADFFNNKLYEKEGAKQKQ